MTRRFSCTLSLVSAIAILVVTVAPLLAMQGGNLPDGPAVGGSVDRFVYEGNGVTTVSFHFSGLRAGKVGSEI